MDREGSDRASAPVVGDVTMVGVGVVAAIVVIVLSLDAFVVLPGQAPVVSASADPYVVGPADTCGVNEVTLRHQSGDVVAVDTLAIVVTVADGRSARLTNFPVESGRLDGSNTGGDAAILSQRCVGGALPDPEGEWAAGTPLTVQLDDGAVERGDRIDVRVVHTPTDTNLTRKRLVAETS